MRKIALFRPKIEFSHEPRSVLIRKDSLGVTMLFDNLLREFRRAHGIGSGLTFRSRKFPRIPDLKKIVFAARRS